MYTLIGCQANHLFHYLYIKLTLCCTHKIRSRLFIPETEAVVTMTLRRFPAVIDAGRGISHSSRTYRMALCPNTWPLPFVANTNILFRAFPLPRNLGRSAIINLTALRVSGVNMACTISFTELFPRIIIRRSTFLVYVQSVIVLIMIFETFQ